MSAITSDSKEKSEIYSDFIIRSDKPPRMFTPQSECPISMISFSDHIAKHSPLSAHVWKELHSTLPTEALLYIGNYLNEASPYFVALLEDNFGSTLCDLENVIAYYASSREDSRTTFINPINKQVCQRITLLGIQVITGKVHSLGISMDFNKFKQLSQIFTLKNVSAVKSLIEYWDGDRYDGSFFNNDCETILSWITFAHNVASTFIDRPELFWIKYIDPKYPDRSKGISDLAIMLCNDKNVHLSMAGQFYDLTDDLHWELALRHYQRALALGGVRSTHVFCRIADIYKEMGNLEMNIANIKVAITVEGKYIFDEKFIDHECLPMLYKKLGDSYSHDGQHLKAIDAFKKSNALFEELFNSYNRSHITIRADLFDRIGKAYKLSGDNKFAEVFIRSAYFLRTETYSTNPQLDIFEYINCIIDLCEISIINGKVYEANSLFDLAKSRIQNHYDSIQQNQIQSSQLYYKMKAVSKLSESKLKAQEEKLLKNM